MGTSMDITSDFRLTFCQRRLTELQRDIGAILYLPSVLAISFLSEKNSMAQLFLVRASFDFVHILA